MDPLRPETFDQVLGCGSFPAGSRLDKASSHCDDPLGTYFGFGGTFFTSEQIQNARDLLRTKNTARFRREFEATASVAGCYGPIRGSSEGEWQLEVRNPEVLQQTGCQRIPNETEVRAARAGIGAIVGGVGGFLLGLAAGRPGLGAVVGAAVGGGAGAAAPIPPPIPARPRAEAFSKLRPPPRPALPLAYSLRPGAMAGRQPSPIFELL